MNTNLNELPVVHNMEKSRFEIISDGLMAELTYALVGDTITFLHTGVPEEWEGQGLGKKLAVTGLEFAKTRGFKIKSFCSFISAYLKRYPEYQNP
jgi:predicted GNAT family acetyltransferase